MKTKIWIGLAFLITFTLGLTTGYLIPREPLNTPRNAWMYDRDSDRPEIQGRGNDSQVRDRLIRELELNDQQRLEFDQVSMKFQQDVRRVLQETNFETREKIRDYHEELNKQMRSILNDNQYAQWQKFHQRRMQTLQEQGERWRRGRRISD